MSCNRGADSGSRTQPPLNSHLSHKQGSSSPPFSCSFLGGKACLPGKVMRLSIHRMTYCWLEGIFFCSSLNTSGIFNAAEMGVLPYLESPCDHSTELEETLDMAEDCPSYQLLSGGKRTIQDLALGGLIVANTYQFEVRKRTATWSSPCKVICPLDVWGLQALRSVGTWGMERSGAQVEASLQDNGSRSGLALSLDEPSRIYLKFLSTWKRGWKYKTTINSSSSFFFLKKKGFYF